MPQSIAVSGSPAHENFAPSAVEEVDLKPPPPPRRPLWRSSLGWLAGSLALAVLPLLSAIVLRLDIPLVAPFMLAGLAAGWGALLAALGLLRSLAAPGALEPRPIVFSALALLGNLAMSFVGLVSAWLATAQFSRGRQLRRWGRVLLAPLEPGGNWLLAPGTSMRADVPLALRAALAEQWRENGRTEHASVAAFSRLSLDLMALGAPASLIASAHEDALDEIRHAELCFELARGLDGQSVSPAAFPAAARARTLPPARVLALAVLAVDSLVDGALHEGVSARIVAQLARRCDEPAIRAVLKQIAVDEGRHAAHGWDVVVFCLREGGSPVAQALHAALRALPEQLEASFHEGARDGAWERYGIPGQALQQAELGKARADIERQLARLIAATRTRAAA